MGGYAPEYGDAPESYWEELKAEVESEELSGAVINLKKAGSAKFYAGTDIDIEPANAEVFSYAYGEFYEKSLVSASFSEFISETKTVTLKRQYTDKHPQMTAGLHAKIRNKVLEAIADGTLNQEELMKIVSEHSTNAKRWFNTNKKYFTVSEDGGVSLSSFGKKILNSIIVHEGNKFTGAATKAKAEGLKEFEFNGKTFPVTVKEKTKVKEEKMNESKETDEAKAILQDLLAEYDPWELNDMLPEEAQDTVESYGHKGTKAKKIAEILLDLATTGTFESKKPFLYESFSEFISSSKPVNEAFKSTRLSNLFATAGNQAKELSKAFYRSTRLQLDQIEDFDLIEVTPDAAYRAKGGSKFVFYISDVEKENPYAPEDSYRTNKMVPGGGYLLAITDADNTFYGTTWVRGETTKGRSAMAFKKIDGKPGNDSIGIGKVYRGYDATGLYNAKRISEVADRAIILDVDILKQRYSSESIRGERAEAKKGATVFMDDKTFKDANIARYNKILSQKAMELPLDKIVLDTIDTLASHIKDAVAKNVKTQYGEILIGKDKKDRDIKLSDAANVMRNLLDDYSRYVSALSSSIESEKRYGTSDTYYKREALNYAKTIQDRVRKIENMDYAW
jgi:hypothetical protein